MSPEIEDVWASGESYEAYVGRWSRPVASEFLAWLGAGPDLRWVDVGCGTGALTEAIVATQRPASVDGIDPSDGFVSFARARLSDERVTFRAGDARALPLEEASRDVVVSGLALNFVPDPAAAVAEFARVLRPGGTAAAYVWDYGGEMQMMRHFWDAAASLDPNGRELDEGRRFPICSPEPLAEMWRSCGMRDVHVRAIDVPTVFADFDDYWRPFLGGQGSAPSYLASLRGDEQARVRELVRTGLPVAADGSIRLIARAWAIRGCR
jgi:SAM-dependent methyltransferase